MMLFLKERYINWTKKLLTAWQKKRAFSDLLGYGLHLDDNLVMMKDGAMIAFFDIHSPDMDSCTENQLDAQANLWKQAIAFLDDGWMLEINVLSEPLRKIAKEHYSEITAQLIADERRAQFTSGQYFTTKTILSLTWKPEKMLAPKYRRFMFDEVETKDSHELRIDAFLKVINEFTDYLSQNIRVKPLTGTQTISYLHAIITGKEQTLVSPPEGIMLNTYLASEDFYNDFTPVIGNQHIGVLALDELPTHSYPGILEILNDFPIPYRWSSRFVSLSQLTAEGFLKRSERNWSSKAIGVAGVIKEALEMPVKLDESAERNAQSIRDAQFENRAGINRFGFYNTNIILMHEDKEQLIHYKALLTKYIQQLNYKVRDESLNATDAYLGSLPGHGCHNLRTLLVDTQYVSHALPISSIFEGERKNPCPFYEKDSSALLLTATQGSRPFYLNCHVGDVGHTAILGPTGNGKSTLIAAMIAAHRKYKDSRIIVLDKDRSNECVIKALSGAYIDLSDDSYQLAPLSKLTPNNAHYFEQAKQWLIQTCELMGVEMTPIRQKYLHEGLERMMSDKPQYKNLEHLTVQEPAVRQVLANLNEGPWSHVLNGTQSKTDKSHIIGFDLTQLVQSNDGLKDYNLPIIKALMNELEDCFKDKRPTLLILEEAWLYLQHDLFRNKLSDWFKTLRKANVSVIFVSQDLSDIVQKEQASIIQNSCMTRIFLPNYSANEPYVAKHYEAFGLNERQIELLRAATPKQDYYYVSPNGKRMFRLDLGHVALSLLCISNKKDVETFREYKKQNPTGWIVDWLEYKKLSEWADYAKTLLESKRYA